MKEDYLRIVVDGKNARKKPGGGSKQVKVKQKVVEARLT